MSIRVFSAQRFYALATGSPIDRSRAVVTVDIEIPERGVRVVAPDPAGETELVWIHGVAARAEQRERFIEDIRAGEIPTPLPTSDTSVTSPRVRYHSLERLHARQQTVVSLLGRAETLVAAAMKSRWVSCPGCVRPLHLFHNATELCDHLLNTLRGESLRIELIGRDEEVTPWATTKGFTPSSPHERRVAIRLDSFTCEPEALRKVEPILASTTRLPHTWLAITSERTREEYGWNGRCANCDITLAPFKAVVARDVIERHTAERSSHEGRRLLHGIPLIELLSHPLGRLLKGPLAGELFSPIQQEVVRALSLENLTLHTTTKDLAPHAVASVALLDLACDVESRRALRLFTAPKSLFSADHRKAVRAIAEKLGTNAGFVWITSDDPSPAKPVAIEPSGSTGRPVARVEISTNTTITIEARRGEWRELSVPASLRDLRVAACLFHHLSGTPHHLIASEAASPFTAHLIPIFPAESSSTRLVAHALGVIEPLAKMFAASHHAKMLGLTPRDLLLGQLRQPSTVCSSCKGTGVLIKDDPLSGWDEACHTCWGSRFRSPIREITFKGRTLWEILNAPLSASGDTLRALPKMKEVLELGSSLGLTDIPLGMPITLLATHQRRLLAIAHAMLSGTPSRPSLIIMEEPGAGLTETQRRGLAAVVAHPAFKERVSWIGVNG